jgi:filamentous hemagglutinin family protein
MKTLSELQRYWKLSVVSSLVLGEAIILTLGFDSNFAWGQVTSDNSLGSESSLITSPIPGAFQIDGGALRGTNLFHSFSEFSVPTLGIAYFNNAGEIQNILSRVTGGSISNIDGLIAANGTANLFILNPNGIILGSNASLNIGGSFVGSTASSLNFADDTQFSATSSQTTPLLTVSVPFGLQYGGNAGSIQVQNSTLQVPNGETLALVGGNVQLNGASLQAEEGRVELGGVAGSGTVALNLDDNNLRLSFPDGVALADVSLSNAASVDTSGEGGGNIQIQGNRITLTDKSGITADTEGNENGGGIFLQASQVIVRDGSFVLAGTFGAGQGGNLTVNASDSVEVSGTTLDGEDSSILGTDTYGAGAAGNVDINTQQLLVRDGGVVSAVTWEQGAGGNLIVNASDSVEVSEGDLKTTTYDAGAAGNLTINTGRLIIHDGAVVGTGTFDKGQGGTLTVTASDFVELVGTSADGLFPSSLSTSTHSVGNAGNLTIDTGRLIVLDGARVSASTFGEGKGGILSVSASDSVEVSGVAARFLSGLLVRTFGDGDAGDLTIDTGRLIVRDGALIAASSIFGQGNAGNLNVTASDYIELIGTSADIRFASGLSVGTQAEGDAGDLTITTGVLIVRNGAQVEASTSGSGQGGTLTVNASDSVELSGTTADGQAPSGLFSRTKGDAAAGELTIATGRLIIRDGATASTSTSGLGDAGDLIVSTSEAVEVRGTSANGNPSVLSTQVNPEAEGDGGNLTIQTGRLTVDGGAQVSAATLGAGRGGTLTVGASDLVKLIGTSANGIPSRLTTQTEGAEAAGDLRIDTRQLIVRDGAQVEAGTFGEGQGGTLSVNASESVEVIGTSADGRVLSGLFVETEGAGAGGSLRIDTGNMIVRDEALVSAQTSGVGQGGNLSLTTGELNVEDGAAISVNSIGTGRAGNLAVTSGSVSLDEGFISATTLSGDGGNISLQVEDLLLMRHGSEISTTAGTAQAGGDGGNITIDTNFIVAVPKEDSDISANAFTGRGGNINITAQGIYGIEFRPKVTVLSDITASSEFGVNGVVEINTPDVDPSQGLAELPVEPVNVEVAEGCQGSGRQASIEFFHTGRGGFAPNPYESLSSREVWEDVQLPTQRTDNSAEAASASARLASPPNKIVEPQGWIINEKGEVTLVAEMPATHSKSHCHLR